MNSEPSAPASNRKSSLLCAALIAAILLVLFFKAFLPEYTIFSNDGPYGQMVPAHNRLPANLTGWWQDLNWLGGAGSTPALDLTTALRLFTSPLLFSKLFCPFSLFVVGVCAWFCFRQYKFSHLACLLVAVATVLNSDFFGTACWGVCSQPIAFGMNFLALGALADTTSPRRWLRVALAGFAVGLGVAEAYDIGALFSLFVAAFVVVQSLVGGGTPGKRMANGFGRLALVGGCAAFIAAAALMTLIGTQVKGVVGMSQDPETKAARWTEATTYSLPKIEVLGMVVPGLFGFRSDSPDGGGYWGRGGSHPSWDEYVDSGGKTGQPGGMFRAGAGSNYSGVLVILLAVFGVAQSLRRPSEVGRVTPCAPGRGESKGGAHGVTRPTTDGNSGPFSRTERRLIWFWSAMAVVAALLMFGRFAPFYQFFYALPYASTIRNPAKFHHLLQWSLLIVFAYGAEALCRIGFSAAANTAGGLGAHWKTLRTKADGFERRWVLGSFAAVGLVALGWLAYASSRGSVEKVIINWTTLSMLGQRANPDAVADLARATARFSVGQVGRTLLFLLPAVGLVAITLSGYFRGARARIGGALLLGLLVADLFPIAREWVVLVNWKEKYAASPVVDFLRERSYEHRVTRFPLELFARDSSRLPREIAQPSQMLDPVYGYSWIQHLFPYYDVQSLDVVQEPRLPIDKAAYEAALAASPLRRWELSNTRYLLGAAGLLNSLNQQFDEGKSRFRTATQFDFVAKPGTSGQTLEEITTTIHTNGLLAVFDFTAALPRAKLYANWKVSTNDPAQLQTWMKGIQQNVRRELGSALGSQSPGDLATLRELADPAFDPMQTVLLAEPLAASTGTNQNPGDVKFESYAPKRIVLAAKANSPAVLLLNDKFDPNWHVTVDGQPAKLLRANFIVRGVFLAQAGEHRVEFKFQPPLTGTYISLAAVVIGLGVLGFLCFAKHEAAAVSPESATKK